MSRPTLPRRPVGRYRPVAAAVGVVVTLALAGCADDPTTPAEFRAAWDQVVAQLPTLEEVTASPADVACQGVLGDLRRERQALPDSPDGVVAELVDDWFSVAESAFFACPPEGPNASGWAQAYERLDAVERAIDDALAVSS